MDIKELLQGIDNCECGKSHACPMDHVIIGNNVLTSLTEICEKYQSILMVSDQNTYRVCGQEVAGIFGKKFSGCHQGNGKK